MPSPSTALEIYRDALALINAVGVDQQLTADETSQGLRIFNNLLEDFSTNNLAVFGLANQTFNTVNGQAVYDIGPTGTWVADRPVRINEPAYATYNNSTFIAMSMTQDFYNRIVDKTQTNQFPFYYLYVNSFPNGQITLWPTPNQVTPITFSIDRVLTAIASMNQTVAFPPAYAKTFMYKLAVESAPFYGKKISQYPDVLQTATETFANIMRANKKLRMMTIPMGNSFYGYGGYNSYIGGDW